jgi:FtsZ-interacting cell division protein ZipA
VSTLAIILICIAAVLLVALIVASMSTRARRRDAKHERELRQRRDEVAGAHRELAADHARDADAAEREARVQQAQAGVQRAEAELHDARADMHERGLADDDLDREHGRFVRDREHDVDQPGAPRRESTSR